MRTSWAILLCKFRNDNDTRNGDDTSEPFTREWYTRFSDTAGKWSDRACGDAYTFACESTQ